LIAGAADLLSGCGCASGCPSCTGPRLEPDVDAKALALRLLRSLVSVDRAQRFEAPAHGAAARGAATPAGPAPATEVPGAAA
jgi:hypothetical protein